MRNADRDTFWLYGIAGAIALALCACGGSDSSPGAPVAGFPSSYNAQAAWRSLTHNAHTWSAQGTGSDGNAYGIQIAYSPANGSFKNVSADGVLRLVSFNRGGSVINSNASTLFMRSGTGVPIGWIASDGSCAAFINGREPDSSVAPNANGSLYGGSIFPDCSSTTGNGDRVSATWSIPVDGSSVLFCEDETLTVGGSSFELQLCVPIDTSGTLGQSVRATVKTGGVSVVMR